VSQQNVEIARRAFEAYGRGDAATALEAIDEQVVYDLSETEGDVSHGHGGMEVSLRRWLGTWESYRVEIEKLVDAGENVLIVYWEHGRGKGSQVPVRQHAYDVWTLRDGKVVRIKHFLDREKAMLDAGVADHGDVG
jgi:ketosteroid isomerase-like protein